MFKVKTLLILLFTFNVVAIEDADARRRSRRNSYDNQERESKRAYRRRGRRYKQSKTPDARDQFFESQQRYYPGTTIPKAVCNNNCGPVYVSPSNKTWAEDRQRGSSGSPKR